MRKLRNTDISSFVQNLIHLKKLEIEKQSKKDTNRNLELCKGISSLKEQELKIQSEITMKKEKLKEIKVKLGKWKVERIQSLLEIFRLRKVSRTTKSGSMIEYRIVNCGMPSLESLHLIPHKHYYKVNSCIFHCIHLIMLLSNYLDIHLPFPMSLNPQQIFDPNRAYSLILSQNQQEDFVNGISMLNFNILFICASQNVEIPFQECTKTLDMLAKLLSSMNLGIDDFGFQCIDYYNVRDFHLTQWKSRPWEIIEKSQDESWLIVEDERIDCNFSSLDLSDLKET